MPTTDHDRAHEALGREECSRLLAAAGIGRLAYTEAALPAVRPVSFVLCGEEVLIPAHAGSRLVDAVRSAVVAFETDVFDPSERTGWSVTVVGPSRVLAGPAIPAGFPGTAVRPADFCLIAVRLGLLQGWRTSLPG